MTHVVNHKQFGNGFGGSMLDLSCEACCRKTVGELDDKNFELLTGLSRREFEIMLRSEYNRANGTGLYNFWYGIMDTKALRAFARREELLARVKVNQSV